MRVLVCGSRHYNERTHVWSVLDELNITEIIEGEARGVDTLARLYGEAHGIPVRKFPADWDRHGKAAGPIRNKQMLDDGKPELVIAFLSENSRGTRNMINQARRQGVRVKVIPI